MVVTEGSWKWAEERMGDEETVSVDSYFKFFFEREWRNWMGNGEFEIEETYFKMGIVRHIHLMLTMPMDEN